MKDYPAHIKLLTNKQLEVLRLAASGLKMQEISEQLKLSKSNVEKMVRNMCEKFQVKSSKELIAYALKNQLL
jgi:DNA-binding NarL/FixJ family response regulator